LDNTLLILNSRIKNFITIVKEYGQLPPVNCFSGQISQVFTNLISNAIDALTECSEANTNSNWKPQITITTQLQPQPSPDANPCIGVAIQDNGPGIPAEIQTKIFETFFTTKPVGRGTGFGLAIARQIVVEKHGGELTLHSELGIGSTFTVLLPAE
jgi:signal transduction histidine kinase